MSVQDEQRALEQYLINNPSDSFAMNIYVDRLELQEFSVEQIQEHIEKDDAQANTADDIAARTAQPIPETGFYTLQLQRLGVDSIMFLKKR